MRMVKICTKLYVQELLDFYLNDIQEFVLETGLENDEHYFCIPEDYIDTEQLVQLMEDIILDSNPVVNDSQKTSDTIKKFVFLPQHQKIKDELTDFVSKEHIFNLDGYIHFRLKEYPEQINTLLYSIVRKNLCLEY